MGKSSSQILIRPFPSARGKVVMKPSDQRLTDTGGSAVLKDPVCGMMVDPETAAASVEHDGVTFYFCSTHCAGKFKAAPETYLAGKAAEGYAHHEAAGPDAVAYVCPMCPEIREKKPGPCPSCGMALEPETPHTETTVEYTCPMHPEVVQQEPGACPICGMALEPRTVTKEEVNPELVDMSRRFWVSAAFTAPILLMTMLEMITGGPLFRGLSGTVGNWVQLLLATPVVLWGGRPFFQRGYASVIRRSLNMF
ncbi:MAG: YHS domain-containing protein, partial [Calditrichaeota bacterium]|nr:YHS domain-containing protein [Calditrichota bacterium]